MNAIMHVYAPNGRLIKISSFPKGFVIKSTTGQTQIATTITNSTIRKVKADAVFTDAAKSTNFSNPLNIDLNLGQKILLHSYIYNNTIFFSKIPYSLVLALLLIMKINCFLYVILITQ
jgi:hypothetical protein